MALSTSAANEALAMCFTVNARASLSAPTAATTVYRDLGKAWAGARRAVEDLSGSDRHVPEDGGSIEGDVKDAILDVIRILWEEMKPKDPGSTVGRALAQRVSTIEAAYLGSYRVAHAAAAADRAAAAPFAGLAPGRVISTPGRPAGLGGEGFHSPRDSPEERATPDLPPPQDLVDLLMQRSLAGGDRAEVSPPGNGGGDRPSVPAIPPSLAQAAKRLTEIGCQPLRVEARAASLATNVLLQKPTFSEYVSAKALTGAPGREAATLARSLDLGTVHYGAGYLMSPPAEVQLRRLLSVCLAFKMGSYKLATLLEELPGDSALAELPDSLLKDLSERLKLECKLEQLTSSK